MPVLRCRSVLHVPTFNTPHYLPIYHISTVLLRFNNDLLRDRCTYTRDKPSNKQTAEVVRISRRIHNLCNPCNRLATHVAATYSPGNPQEVWYQVHRANRVDWVESGVGAWQLVTRQPGVSGDDVCRFIGAHQRWAWACSTSRSPHGSAMTSNSQVPPDKGLCHQEVAPDLGLQLPQARRRRRRPGGPGP